MSRLKENMFFVFFKKKYFLKHICINRNSDVNGYM